MGGFGGHRGGGFGRFRADDVDNAPRKIKGLGPGIVEKFDSKVEAGQVGASEQLTKVFNGKFLMIVLVFVIIALAFYLLRKQHTI